MHRSRVNVFDEICIACRSAATSYAAAALCAKFGQWCAFNVAQMADGNNNLVVGIKVFRIKLFSRKLNLCTAHVAILFFDFVQLIFHHLTTKFVVSKNAVVIIYLAFQLLILLM